MKPISMKLLTKYYEKILRDDKKENLHKYKNMTPVKEPLHKVKNELIRLYERKREYKDNKEWIQLYEKKQKQILLTDEEEEKFKRPVYKDIKKWIELYEKIYEKKQKQILLTDEEEEKFKRIEDDLYALKEKKEKNNLEFEKIYKEKIDEEFKDFDKNYKIDKKIQSIPTFSEIKQKKEDLIALQFKERLDMLELEKSKRTIYIWGQNIKFHLETNIKYIRDKIDSVEKDLAHLFP
jgi:hypothetical protein